MTCFNERIGWKASQGWGAFGAFVPEGWSNRLFAGTMTGFYFEVEVPGICSLRLGGVAGKGVVIGWGERGKYQIYFEGPEEGRVYRSVYSRPGRFELGFYGELESVKTLRCSEPVLHGFTSRLRQLSGLEVIDLQGTSVHARCEDFSALALRELIFTDAELAGDFFELGCLTGLEVLNLEGVRGLSGYLNAVARMPWLRVLNVRGCGLSYYPDVLPLSWVAPVVDVADNGFSSAEVDQFLQDLANASIMNGVLDIGGSNGAHTELSDEALLVLEALGWTLRYNGAAPLPPRLAITEFRFLAADNPVLTADVTGIVFGRYIKVYLPSNTPVTALAPSIAVTEGATVVPESGAVLDFTASVM